MVNWKLFSFSSSVSKFKLLSSNNSKFFFIIFNIFIVFSSDINVISSNPSSKLNIGDLNKYSSFSFDSINFWNIFNLYLSGFTWINLLFLLYDFIIIFSISFISSKLLKDGITISNSISIIFILSFNNTKKFVIESFNWFDVSLDNFLKFSNELKYKESNVSSYNFVEFITSLYSFSIFFVVDKELFIWSLEIIILSFLLKYLSNISSVFDIFILNISLSLSISLYFFNKSFLDSSNIIWNLFDKISFSLINLLIFSVCKSIPSINIFKFSICLWIIFIRGEVRENIWLIFIFLFLILSFSAPDNLELNFSWKSSNFFIYSFVIIL